MPDIGLKPCCSSTPQVWHLTKVYWYTVEFGVVREGDAVKAFGAGAVREMLQECVALIACCRASIPCNQSV